MAFTASMVVTQRRERERRESRARDELEHREERASHADSLDAEGGLAGSAGGHGYKPSSIMTKRKRRAQPHPFADKDLRVAEVEQGDVLVPIRMALEHLETREGSRGLVLFALFFSMYFCHTSEALDAPQGRKTLKWYADAIKSKYDLTATDENGFCAVTDFGFECYTPFVERNSVEEVLEFLEHDLGIVMRGIKEFCPTCLIGITAVNRDLRILSLGQMICSDFYFNVKTIGDLTSSDFKQFPDRNCTSGDEKWSKNPIVASAPCCDSVQLGLASLTLLALNGIEPTPSSSLGNLQNEMVRKNALDHYVRRAIDANEAIIQLVVLTPDEHAVGIAYTASWRQKEYLPDQVETTVTYWSYFFRPYSPFLIAAFVFCVFSTIHEVFEQWSIAHTLGEAARNVFLSPFMVFIEIPTIILPWVAEGIGPLLELRVYALLVSIIELIMFLRVFQEGQVLPPFRLVVKTLIYALPQLLWFTSAMLATVMVFAGIDQQLFGRVDDNYADYGSSFISMFSVVIEGANNDGPAFELSPEGANMMYVIANIFLFLIIAQFFIAILVGAFDHTREAENDRRMTQGLCSGCVDVSQDAPISTWLKRTAGYLFMYRQWGVFAPVLRRTMTDLITEADSRAEAALDGAKLVVQPLLLTHLQCVHAFGPIIAELLSLHYGAEVTNALHIRDELLLRKLAPGEKPRTDQVEVENLATRRNSHHNHHNNNHRHKNNDNHDGGGGPGFGPIGPVENHAMPPLPETCLKMEPRGHATDRIGDSLEIVPAEPKDIQWYRGTPTKQPRAELLVTQPASLQLLVTQPASLQDLMDAHAKLKLGDVGAPAANASDVDGVSDGGVERRSASAPGQIRAEAIESGARTSRAEAAVVRPRVVGGAGGRHAGRLAAHYIGRAEDTGGRGK